MKHRAVNNAYLKKKTGQFGALELQNFKRATVAE